uniref:Transposase IS66 central domain-containing protein n=2 Tax=environmental samples TaxID=48479 RepID=A0A0H3U9Q3_9BACT|nr:hypothetical protein [uncultured bacterium Ele45G2]AIF26563.1 hypothetical protein [uncultured bacterium fosmid pJB45G2]
MILFFRQICLFFWAHTRDLADVTPEERYAERQKRSLPVVEVYSAWLKQQQSRTLPKSLVGQAIAYSLNQWKKLTAFLVRRALRAIATALMENRTLNVKKWKL